MSRGGLGRRSNTPCCDLDKFLVVRSKNLLYCGNKLLQRPKGKEQTDTAKINFWKLLCSHKIIPITLLLRAEESECSVRHHTKLAAAALQFNPALQGHFILP